MTTTTPARASNLLTLLLLCGRAVAPPPPQRRVLSGTCAPCANPPCAAPLTGKLGSTVRSGTDARTSTHFPTGTDIYGPLEERCVRSGGAPLSASLPAVPRAPPHGTSARSRGLLVAFGAPPLARSSPRPPLSPPPLASLSTLHVCSFGAGEASVLSGLGCSDPSSAALAAGYGGLDTQMAEANIAHACGVTLPRIDGAAYVSLLDECGHDGGGFKEGMACLCASTARFHSPVPQPTPQPAPQPVPVS